MSDINVFRTQLCGTEDATNIEMAIENIIKEVNCLNQLLIFDKSYELIYFEDDVYKHLKCLSIKEKNNLINKLLRIYFRESDTA
ncbi:hypothetical protein [Lysinibacillus telephonicus]|uniref:Uncharacterized protein n=1 Tax=Lysinibacillus telephonicus TaxID=1714840 RepID=A0A3S0JSM4_9BACI|nr:hypothetical protein [Lysinibacillus telephonicus]RKJ33045.1 hypothetical protein D7X33_39320 [Butyricicoccus sp. 1XD8-22]RTQ93806.1 hypothetical protein EKG35_07670 [Lysinibacillus telephonicus]